MNTHPGARDHRRVAIRERGRIADALGRGHDRQDRVPSRGESERSLCGERELVKAPRRPDGVRVALLLPARAADDDPDVLRRTGTEVRTPDLISRVSGVVHKVGMPLRGIPDSRVGALIFDGVHYAQETRELAISLPDAISGVRDCLGEASLPCVRPASAMPARKLFRVCDVGSALALEIRAEDITDAVADLQRVERHLRQVRPRERTGSSTSLPC